MRRTLLAAALAMVVAACSGPEGPTASLPTFNTAPTTTGAPGATAPGTTATPTLSPSSTTAPTVTSTTEGGATATTTTTVPDGTEGPAPVLALVADGFTRPVFVTAPPGDDRLFVVEQDGRIQVLRRGERPGAFLDVSSLVSYGGERGLLGLAFHPGYPADPRFYVDYTDEQGATVVAEYRVSADPDRGDAASGRLLLRVPQPYANHNGGMIAFGPDGYLYIAMGDGGGAGDPEQAGQDPASLLGSILRLDVEGDPYALPPNPWTAMGGAPEVWAKGLRNPWRFSFDSGFIFIGDVGQDAREEINVAAVGAGPLNFGWSVMEGSDCYLSPGCDQSGLLPPALEYSHEEGHCSVTGGYVYRGAALPDLAGTYFYGDYCSGMIASFRYDVEGPFDLRDWTASLGARPGLTSFGIDGRGELHLAVADGRVYRLESG